MIRANSPWQNHHSCKTAVDARRLRALTIRNLEIAAQNGDTLRSRDDVLRDLRTVAIEQGEQSTSLTVDLMGLRRRAVRAEIRIVSMADKRPAYQLERSGKAVI